MPNTLSSESAGQKRKRATNTVKYYSVRVGHNPGIYYAWPDCQVQITGFKGAQFKSFTTLSDAESFMRGNDPMSSAGAGPKVQKYYAVRNGRKPGIYLDWPSAQQQITNWTRPQYKSFLTRVEAEAFIKDSSTTTKESPAKKRKVTKEPPSSITDKRNKDAVSVLSDHVKTPLGVPGRNTVGANREPSPPSDLDSSSFVSFDPEAPEDDGPVVIYTDGSALGNGKVGSVAGVGVYFGSNHPMNVSEPLAGPVQTNNRAELTAIIRAVELAPKNRDILIRSDSRYSIDCYTNWYQSWRRNNWLTAGRKTPVENRDLVELGREKIEERDSLGVKTSFEWLRGHANDPGNEAADRLAVAAAELAKRDRTFR